MGKRAGAMAGWAGCGKQPRLRGFVPARRGRLRRTKKFLCTLNITKYWLAKQTAQIKTGDKLKEKTIRKNETHPFHLFQDDNTPIHTQGITKWVDE